MTTHLAAYGFAIVGPVSLLLLCMILGTILLFANRARTGRALVALGTLGFILIAVLPLDSWALAPLENRFPRLTTLPNHVDGIIVLGGFADPDANGTAGLTDAAERLTSFAMLARHYPQARLVFTGTSPSGPERVSEAEAVRNTMGDLGIDPARITLERKSWDTYENAVFSKALIEPKPGETWLLVTSASHMPRSVGVFRKVGWDVIPYPTAYKSGERFVVTFPLHALHLDLAAHEWIGLLDYSLRGRTDALFPGP